VVTVGGATIALQADTICLHGDTPGAADLARAVRCGLEAAGIRIAALANS
jgi:5-oxoprolinase (ATP-hydrolysing) subunit A